MEILREIRWAYQRVVRGYDDRVYWQFDDYFIQIIPALKNFCLDELKKEYTTKELNKARYEVFTKTLKYISAYEKEVEDGLWENKKLSKLLEYVGKNIGTYWD